jgi:hypothetical protein
MVLSCGCRGGERCLSTAFGCMTREREGEQRDAAMPLSGAPRHLSALIDYYGT